MANASDATLVQVAADGQLPFSVQFWPSAKKFVEGFYHALNASDQSDLASYYSPTAGIIWNGNPLSGPEAFISFFSSMPMSIYEVQSYDAQPISEGSFLVICAGIVKYGDNKEPRGFSETFLLKRDRGQFLIATQGFRLVV